MYIPAVDLLQEEDKTYLISIGQGTVFNYTLLFGLLFVHVS